MQDGLVDLSGVATSAVRGRIAFDVFTCYDAAQLTPRTYRKFRKYGDAVAAAGDTFVAPAFTTTGCPYPSALSFSHAQSSNVWSEPVRPGPPS